MRGLRDLNIAGNEVTDVSIPHINKLPLLENLYIGFTDMTEGGICSIKRLKNLTGFGVGRLSVNRLVNILKDSNQLKILSLEACKLTKENLTTIANIKQLVELSINDNRGVNDRTLKLLVPLQNLERINLRRTHVTAASIETFKMFPKLTTVIIGFNQWSEADMDRFKATYPNILLHVEVTSRDAAKD